MQQYHLKTESFYCISLDVGIFSLMSLYPRFAVLKKINLKTTSSYYISIYQNESPKSGNTGCQLTIHYRRRRAQSLMEIC